MYFDAQNTILIYNLKHLENFKIFFLVSVLLTLWTFNLAGNLMQNLLLNFLIYSIIVNWMNSYPRKILNGNTPFEAL